MAEQKIAVELTKGDVLWLIGCYEKDEAEADATDYIDAVKYDRARIAYLQSKLVEFDRG
jgi:hypothetical protein